MSEGAKLWIGDEEEDDEDDDDDDDDEDGNEGEESGPAPASSLAPPTGLVEEGAAAAAAGSSIYLELSAAGFLELFVACSLLIPLAPATGTLAPPISPLPLPSAAGS